jgi:hypothetical protein
VKSGSIRVIDTNVLLVANEQHPGVSPGCIIACVDALSSLTKNGVVVIDDSYEILEEYGRKTAPKTGNRVGDVFLKWLLQNVGNAQRVQRVSISRHEERGYAEFPDDPELGDFDPDDRKFVAVAASHVGRPAILQGSDSRWLEWSGRLSAHGIMVEFLCPSDIASFLKRRKTG